MKTAVSNRQKACSIDTRGARKLAILLLSRALGSSRAHCGELSLVFMDDAGIRPLKEKYFGIAEATDVIAFRYEPIPGHDAGWCGEIVVNAQRALEEGRTPQGASRELALYIAHGCDHLAGGTDESPAARRRMRRRELKWLREADQAGLLERLIRSAG